MKVFFIQDALINAGTEKSYLEILPKLSEKIIPVLIYFYPRHDLFEQFENAGVKVIFLDLKGKYDFFNGIIRLRSVVKQEKPDIMVSSLLRANIISRMVSLIEGTPLIGTLVSDSYSKEARKIKSPLVRLKFNFFWFLDRITASIPKHYISNSNHLVSSHSKYLGISSAKVDVIYRGREIPDNCWNNSVNKTCRFLAIGRLIPLKGYMELILAFKKVKKKYPCIELTIFGEGVYRKDLENLISNLNFQNCIFLPGSVPNVTNRIFDFNCFIFPSWYEGFSGALVEAMMAGIPILASDIPMNLEAVQDKKTALVFPVRNVDALADQMIYAIEHPEEMAEMGRRAREIAINRFDINLIAQQYEEVLWNVYHRYAQKA
ncbi:glycosyltransferase [Belliella pelovolcani]|nr:glycosyltransferase [Belliella pelovolcani]